MIKKQKIVIIGGGFAGIKTALELASDVLFDITLITPRNRFEYHGAMYRSATGKSPLEVVIPLSKIFLHTTNVSIEFDSVIDILADKKQIKGESGEYYHYDKLVVSIGNTVNYFNIPGMAENSETLYNIPEAITLRYRLITIFKAKPSAPIAITIIGGGPTGVEVASDILTLAKAVSEKYNLPHLDIHPKLFEAGPRILTNLSEQASVLAMGRLKKIGVDVHTNVSVHEAKKNQIITDKGVFKSDVIIWTAGTRSNSLLGRYPDIFSLDKRRRVVVNDYFQSNDPNVFVIGDAANTKYSGLAQTAIHNAIWLSNNFKRALAQKAPEPYTPQQPKYVVPIGEEWAILQTNDGIVAGKEGWKARREADEWALENFLPYDIATQHLSYGERLAQI